MEMNSLPTSNVLTRSDPDACCVEIVRPEHPTFACVIPAFNEAENLAQLIPQLDKTLRELGSHYSIVIVDDGSSDATATVAIAHAARYPVRLVQLSRNFGKENAITAGLDHVDADFVILMDADCQHPVELIPQFVEHWRNGYDMVYGVICDRANESFIKRRATRLFYKWLSRTASIPIIPDAGDFRLFDRQVVNALKALGERSRFMKGLYSWVGFRSIGVTYQPAARHAGRSQFSLRQLSRLALTGFTSFSDIPLRVWSVIGGVISLCSIFYGLYIIFRTMINGVDVPGWATVTVSMTLLGGLQLFSIGVLGEYIGRIFTEVKGRPAYLVRCRYGFEQRDRKSDE